MTLWSFANFQETFLDQSLWICKWVSWWCHRLTIFHSFCTQKWQKFHIFSYENVRLALIPLWIDAELCKLQYILIWGTYYHKFGQNIKIFKLLWTKYMASSEVMTSSTHSFAYSYRLVQKCFVKICETSKFHNFLIFQPIFITFSLLCLKIFTLFLKFKLNLFRISP